MCADSGSFRRVGLRDVLLRNASSASELHGRCTGCARGPLTLLNCVAVSSTLTLRTRVADFVTDYSSTQRTSELSHNTWDSLRHTPRSLSQGAMLLLKLMLSEFLFRKITA